MSKKLWMYARASDESRQEGSPEQQVEAMMPLAKELCERDGFIFSPAQIGREYGSANDLRWNERTVLKGMMHDMQAGDALLVWKLNRLDRSFFGQIECCGHLYSRNIRVIMQEGGCGKPLDLGTIEGQALLMGMALASSAWSKEHSENTKRGMRRMRQLGYANGGSCPPYGRIYKRIKTNEPGRKRDTRLTLLWDVEEVKHILEIVWRHQHGESYPSIAKDFYARGLHRAARDRHGKPLVYWTHPTPSSLKCRIFLETTVISAAYKWAVKELDEQGHIAGLPLVPPEQLANIDRLPLVNDRRAVAS